MKDNSPALEVKEDGQIWLIPSLPEHPSFCNKRACIHSEDSQNGPPCSECETFFKEYETALASAERIPVSNQEVARMLCQSANKTGPFHHCKLEPGIYPIPDLKWEAKWMNKKGGVSDKPEAYKVAVISLPESKKSDK